MPLVEDQEKTPYEQFIWSFALSKNPLNGADDFKTVYDKMESFLKDGADARTGFIVLAVCAEGKMGNRELIENDDYRALLRLFLQYYGDINQRFDLNESARNMTLLHEAASNNASVALTILLENGADPFLIDSRGWHALDWIHMCENTYDVADVILGGMIAQRYQNDPEGLYEMMSGWSSRPITAMYLAKKTPTIFSDTYTPEMLGQFFVGDYKSEILEQFAHAANIIRTASIVPEYEPCEFDFLLNEGFEHA